MQVLDIYAASEQPIPGVDAQALVEAIRRTGTVGGGGVHYAQSIASGVAALAHIAREGDAILTLGAGNVTQASAMLLEKL